jgi:putative endonuclease
MKEYYVYILASKKDGVLYIGVTNNLMRRVYEHKNSLNNGFTDKYFIGKLVYFEQTDSIETAIVREKQMKRWKREWKITLIEKNNPNWDDLYYEYGGEDIDETLRDNKVNNNEKS